METTRFLNLDCVRLKNESIELLVTQSVGPRIIRLSFLGGKNLLAELPDLALDCPGKDDKLNLYGGHRLWHAPQIEERTYLPDNQPVEIKAIEKGLVVIQPTEAETCIQKSLRITLPDNSPTVVVDHSFKNEGMWPIETAPWAITQLPKGGVAIMPQLTENVDATEVWPNRSIALWPFTDINSSHIHWGNRFIFVEANMHEGMLKFGLPNPDGWLAYHCDDTLFVKHAVYQQQAPYFDRGSSSQVYCDPSLIELETVAPKSTIAPGDTVTHRETWTLYSNIEFEQSEEAAQTLVTQLNITSLSRENNGQR